jgi:hypothetical protein
LGDAQDESGRHNAAIRTVRRWVVLPIADLAWRFHDVMCLTLWRIPKVRSVRFGPLGLVNILTKRAAEDATRRRRRRRESYRIGVNLGDVLIEGDDIVGGGVNIPARLEGIGEPGGIKYFRQRLRSRSRLVGADFVELTVS